MEEADDRPLLAVADRRAKVEELLARRRTAYESIPHHIDTTGLTVEEIADRVLALWAKCAGVEAGSCPPLQVRYPGGEYAIHLAEGALCRLGELLLEAGLGGPVVVVSNPTVWELYGPVVERALRAGARRRRAPIVLIPDGEEYKTLETVARLYRDFVAGGLDRTGVVVALGGGVVGDVAGFAAATYMRGVAFVPVPTTLLAMVDASVGGKTGVDLPEGKNLVGAFKQPSLVVADPLTLRTLPEAEWRCGLAEIVKAAIIADPELFEMLEELGVRSEELGGYSQLATHNSQLLIRRALAVKIAVVEEDPFERGRRAVLNLGHTVGHALERLSGYRMKHGNAVSIGMVTATRIAHRMGLCDAEVPERIESLLRKLGLPVRCPDFAPEAIWEAMQTDKKRRRKTLRWVLPRAIGEVEIRDDVPKGVVVEVLKEMVCCF
ncbi:MAG: 3-dehydroquinate synthase [Chloroflexi bacterium]|nr:MAG: 3-dehydroquinate synthase [Chloroflexota bacterium]